MNNTTNSIDLTEESDNNANFIKFYNSIKGTCGLAWSKNNFLVKSSAIYSPIKPTSTLISLECSLNPINPKLHCKLPTKEGLKIKKFLFNSEGNLIFCLSTLGELEVLKFNGWNSLESIFYTDCKVNFLDFITLNSLKEFGIKLNLENITKSSSIRLPTLGFSNSIFPSCFLGVLEDGRLVIGKSTFGDQFQLHYEQLPFIPTFNHYSHYNTKLINAKLDLWLDNSVIITSIIKDSLGYKLIAAKLTIKDKLKWLGSPSIIDILLMEDNIQLAKGPLYTITQPLAKTLTIITCHMNSTKDKLQLKFNELNLGIKQRTQRFIELGKEEDLRELNTFNYTSSEDKILILSLSTGKIQFRSLADLQLIYLTLDVYEILKLKPTKNRNIFVNQLIVSPNQTIIYCTTNTNQQFTLNLLEFDFSSLENTLTNRENRLFSIFTKSYLNRKNCLDIMKAINDLNDFAWVNKVINELLPNNSLFEDTRINTELMEFQWIIYRYLPNHQSHSQSILLFLQYYFTLDYWLSQLEGNGLENLEQVFVIGSGNASEILRGKSINFIVDNLPNLIPHLHWILNSFLPFYQQLDQNQIPSQLHYLLSYNHFRTIFPPLLVLAWKIISQVAANAHKNSDFQPYQKLIRSFPLSLDQLMAFLSQIVRYLNQKHPKDTTQSSHWIVPKLPDWSLQSLSNLPQGLITNFSQEFKKSRGVNCEWLGLTKAFDFNFPPHLNSIDFEKENLFYFELDKGSLSESNLVDWINKSGWSLNSEKFICSRCCRNSFKFNYEQLLLTHAFEFKCICGGYWWPIPNNF